MTSRRDFISATALTIGTASAALPLASAAQAPAGGPPASGFNEKAFYARLNAPYRHKQVFATARFAKGAVLAYMLNSLNAYQFGFKDGPGTLHAAGVLYGTGVVLGFDDYAWREYGLGTFAALDNEDEYLKTPNAHNPHSDGNPFTRATSSLNVADAPNDEHGFYHDRSMEALRKRGASFFVCSNAVANVGRIVAKAHGKAAAAIKRDLAAHLAPGAILVPAGVAAINAAQEAKFSLFQATTV